MSDKQKLSEKQAYIKKNKMKLRDKDYLQVAHRVVVFRKEHPNWTIETNVKTIGEDEYVFARVAAPIEDGNCTALNTIATAHKRVRVGGQGPSGKYPVETAETGAIGRALAFCGYGTLAGDIDEYEQIADAPA